jgi:Fe2+ transport system protein FeoA
MAIQTPKSFFTLSHLPTGVRAVVKHVGSDLLDLERLKVMGLCEGQTVRVLRGGDRLIVCSCGTRIGMSRNLAEQITVEPITEPGKGAQ